MIKNITNYIRIFFDCQKMRVHHHKSYKKLFSILLNNVISFHIVILNFITDMLSAKNSYIKKTCNVILIMIDKITKHVTYVVIIINLKTDEFVNIL